MGRRRRNSARRRNEYIRKKKNEKILIIVLIVVAILILSSQDFNLSKNSQEGIRITPSWSIMGGENSNFGSCAAYDMIEGQKGFSNIKKNGCKTECGNKNMEYHSYECERDKFIFFCKYFL